MLTRSFKLQNAEPVEAGSGAPENVTQESGTQAAQESGTQEQNNMNDAETEFSIDSLPKEAQDIIKSLRAENAKTRTDKNNLSTRLESIEKGFQTMFGGEEGQELSPEEQIEQLQGGYESLSYDNAVMGIAYEYGIPMENYEYFNFLMSKTVDSLEEGQELSEEELTEVIQRAKGFNSGGMNSTNSSVDENGQAPDPQGQSGLTLESFVKMTLAEKSELFRKSPAIYNQYMKQAKEGRLLK